MRHKIISIALGLALLATDAQAQTDRFEYRDILDISLTPGAPRRHNGVFSDMGSWMGFSLPEKGKPTSGFCGPFSILHRNWYARSLVSVEGAELLSASYFPGEVRMLVAGPQRRAQQRMQFVDDRTALLIIDSAGASQLTLSADSISADMHIALNRHTVTISNRGGEAVMVTFPDGTDLTLTEHNYRATLHPGQKSVAIAISLVQQETEAAVQAVSDEGVLASAGQLLLANDRRWNGYLEKVIRSDMPASYNRIAVKSIVTLLSNWRARRGAVYHDGIVPSHAVNYFVGCWAWDCWRFSAAMASFFPQLAKDNIRVMFDYQQPDGMVIDCIYPDASENNARDSKPPLAAWAVNEVYEHTKDVGFLREMYPKLLKYHKWWYEKRDHDHNGICEFGSVDGTLEAAAWESGMDNAIRFDGTKMLQNATDAWSCDQESVDLNGFLALEYTLLKKFAGIIGEPFTLPDHRERIAQYFFDNSHGFFFDRKLDAGRTFVAEPGCEGYVPFWAGIASKQQFAKARRLLDNPNKFSTFIPFPTIAADNPKYDHNGYWRGPIWLDQTYYGIHGYRNYGFTKKADAYTDQVFTRLEGIQHGTPIYENYDTFTGKPLEASHFSWSAASLLMLYNEYGK